MRYTKLSLVIIMAAALALFGAYDAMGRGGFHGGGGFRGGGSHGGEFRGGGEGYHGGGEFRGGGDRPGYHGGGEYHGDHGNHGDHGGNNRNNNNGNTTNNVNVQGYGGGWGPDGWGYGAADGAIAGLAVGAAIGAASQPSTVIIDQQDAPQVPQQPVIPSIGSQVLMLPPGCQSRNVDGALFYQSGTAWYRPLFGASGVYYQVVPPPPAPGGNANS